jgi:hypothetical protein
LEESKPRTNSSIAEMVEEEDEATPFHSFAKLGDGELTFSALAHAARKDTQETSLSRKYTKESMTSEPIKSGLNLGSNTTLTSLEREDSINMSPVVIPEFNKLTEHESDNKHVLNLDLEIKSDPVEFSSSPPVRKRPFLKRSTSLQVNPVEGTLADLKPSESANTDPTKDTEFAHRGSQSSKILEDQIKRQNLLREKLQKIKILNLVKKGYETLSNYISLVQNFEEYTQEAKILIDDATKDISHHLEQIRDDKFKGLAPKLIDLMKVMQFELTNI